MAWVSLDASAQDPNYYYTNRTVQNGFVLPHVPVPHGYDEVRAADGTTCRSSMSGNGSYLDVGGIGNQDVDGTFNSGSVYARVIIPLGERPRRLDCTKLYKNEIERLRHELALLKMGANGLASGNMRVSGKSAWADEGWTNENWRDSAKGQRNTLPQPARLGGKKIARPSRGAPHSTQLAEPHTSSVTTTAAAYYRAEQVSPMEHNSLYPPLPPRKAEAFSAPAPIDSFATNPKTIQRVLPPPTLDWKLAVFSD